MNCNELAAAMKKAREQLRKTNVELIRVRYPEMPANPDKAEAWLKNKFAMDNATARSILNAAATPESVLKQIEHQQKIGDDAHDFIKSWDENGGMKGMYEKLRAGTVDAINYAINSEPKNIDAQLEKTIGSWVGGKTLMQIGEMPDGTAVWAGSNMKPEMEHKVKQLLLDPAIKQTGLTETQVRETLYIYGTARADTPEGISKNINSYLKKFKDEYDAGKAPVFKRVIPIIQNAQLVAKIPSVQKLMQNDFKHLDNTGAILVKEEILKKTVLEDGTVVDPIKDNYFHNQVAIYDQADTLDRIMDRPTSISDFRESKKYPNALEMMLQTKKIPATFDFVESTGAYFGQVARRMRNRVFEQKLRKDGEKADFQDVMRIFHKGKAERAVITRDMSKVNWKEPETHDGQMYFELTNVIPKGHGIYVHPVLFKWINSTVKSQRGMIMDGIQKGVAIQGMFFKTPILALGFGQWRNFHGLSLIQKAVVAGLSLHTKAWAHPLSVAAKGGNMIANRDPLVIELAEGGMTFSQGDAVKFADNIGNYDVKTGDLKAGVKIHQLFKSTFGKMHTELFESFMPNLKTGMAAEITATAWFKDLEAAHGRQYAIRRLSDYANNTFSGANLELIGRSKGFQSFLQAFLLAPQWQEAKFTRLFGTVFADSPQMRNAYRMALMVEGIGALTTTYVVHHLLSQLAGGTPMAPDEYFKDALLEGNLGMVRIKTVDDKIITLRLHGSFIEDLRPILKLMKSIRESISVADKLPWYQWHRIMFAPIMGDLGTEIKNKLAPIPKWPVTGMAAMEQFRALESYKKGKELKPTAFDYSELPLPIPMQSAIYALRGGYGKSQEERLGWAILAGMSGTAGLPIETRAVKKKDKKKKKKLEMFK